MCSIVGYFIYTKYLKKHIEIVELVPDQTEYKRRPDDPGGIKIANSESLVYDNLSNNQQIRTIKIISNTEKPILLPSRVQNSDSVDMILSNMDSSPTSAAIYEFDITKSKNITRKNISNIMHLYDHNPSTSNLHHKGIYWIELSAAITEESAIKEWKRIKNKFNKSLHNKEMYLEKVYANDDSVFFLIIAGSFDNFNKAQMVCRELIHKKQNCLVRR